MRQAVTATGHEEAGFTPHCMRAGWASHRFATGQPFTELREDGRWKSDCALRAYLDAIAAANYLEQPLVTALPQWCNELDRALLILLRL